MVISDSDMITVGWKILCLRIISEIGLYVCMIASISGDL
jgi:hypothetical protein